MEAHKQVVRLVPQLEHTAPLGAEVSARVQGGQGFVGDLEGRGERSTRFLFLFLLKSPQNWCRPFDKKCQGGLHVRQQNCRSTKLNIQGR